MSSATPAPFPTKPKAIEHLNTARRNYSLYLKLKDEGEYLEWCVTLLFYCALHLAQAYICEKLAHGFVPRTHQDREGAVMLHLPTIREDYLHLQTRSNRTRYDCHSIAKDGLQNIEKEQFRRIRDEVAKHGFHLNPPP